MLPAGLVELDRRNGLSLLINPGTGTWAACTPAEIRVLSCLPGDNGSGDLHALGAALVKRLRPTVKRDLTLPPPFSNPSHAFISLTDACNLRCRYCYADREKHTARGMDTSAVIALLDELARSGHKSVNLTGGEPFLREDLGQIVTSAVERGLKVRILTNGTLVTPQTAALLGLHGVTVCVSLDSYYQAENDFLRGKGVFKCVIAGLSRLKKEGVSIHLGAVLTRVNWFRVGDMYALTRILGLGLEDIRLVIFMPLGRGAVQRRLILSLNQIRELRNRLRSAAYDWFGRDEIRRVAVAESPELGWVKLSCGVARSEFSIGADGCLYPCRMLQRPEFRVGPVLGRDLRTLREQSIAMTDKAVKTIMDIEQCSTCSLRLLCGGGCRAVHAGFTDDLNRNSPYWCAVLKGEIIESLWERMDRLTDGVTPWFAAEPNGSDLRPTTGTCWAMRKDRTTVLANGLSGKVRMLNPAGSRIWNQLTAGPAGGRLPARAGPENAQPVDARPEGPGPAVDSLMSRLVEEGFLRQCE